MPDARTNGQVRRSGRLAGRVNGPEDAAVMAVVQRLRQRIFTVSQKGTLKQVRNFLIRGGPSPENPVQDYWTLRQRRIGNSAGQVYLSGARTSALGTRPIPFRRG